MVVSLHLKFIVCLTKILIEVSFCTEQNIEDSVLISNTSGTYSPLNLKVITVLTVTRLGKETWPRK